VKTIEKNGSCRMYKGEERQHVEVYFDSRGREKTIYLFWERKDFRKNRKTKKKGICFLWRGGLNEQASKLKNLWHSKTIDRRESIKERGGLGTKNRDNAIRPRCVRNALALRKGGRRWGK